MRSTLSLIRNLQVPSSLLLGLFALNPNLTSLASDASENLRQNWLLHPTPSTSLREMSTDRPDKTESAYTVDAGHFQIESDLVTYSRDHDTSGGADTLVEGWTFAALNLKAGITDWMDVQLVLDSYSHVTTNDRIARRKVTQSGFGDLTTRVKMNLWGNNGGSTALAVMPYATFPTSEEDLGSDKIQGGLIVPLAVDLPWGWGMGLMTEVDIVADDPGDDHTADFVNTVTFSHDIVGNLGGYVEFFSQVSAEARYEWIGTFDLGLTYAITENVQLDAGVNIGVTDSADDINPFLGLSWRY